MRWLPSVIESAAATPHILIAHALYVLCREEEELKQVKSKLKSLGSEASKLKNQLSSIAADREKCQRDMEVANRQLMELGSLPEAFEKYVAQPTRVIRKPPA